MEGRKEACCGTRLGSLEVGEYQMKRGVRVLKYSPLLYLPASGTAGRCGGSHRGDKEAVSRGHQYPEPPKTGTVRGPLTALPQVLCGLLGALLREEECRKAERSLNPPEEVTRDCVGMVIFVQGCEWGCCPRGSKVRLLVYGRGGSVWARG